MNRPEWAAWFGVSRSVGCRLHLHRRSLRNGLAELVAEVSVPIPLLMAKPTKHRFEVPLHVLGGPIAGLALASVHVDVDFSWEPCRQMEQQAPAPAFPKGTLRL